MKEKETQFKKESIPWNKGNKKYSDKECVICGSKFYNRRKDSKCCSFDCRNKLLSKCHAHHPRKREKEKQLVPTFLNLLAIKTII